MGHPVRALIVDDSASVRQTLASILDADPDIEVIGTAADPYAAARRIAQEAPDVITLDVEMPRMDGITFLRKLMAQHPIPVVMCSSLTEEGSATLMQALEAGAVDVILKPRVDTKQGLIESGRPHLRRRESRRPGQFEAAARAKEPARGQPGETQRRCHAARANSAAVHGPDHRDRRLHRCVHGRHRIAPGCA